jgi:hypothetical protein
MKHAKTTLRRILCLRGSALGFAEESIFGMNQSSLLETFADGTDYSFRQRNFRCVAHVKTYLSVTFNAVVKPALTVAVVLTLAKPGADTVTV